MEVQSEHGLLVVNLENCITSDSSCDQNILSKANSCIYTAAMSGSHESPVVQLATPIQCQTLPRIQHQHVTQLQPIQYSQAVSYEPSQQLQHSSMMSNPTLYQPMSITTAPIHHYTPANPYISNPTLPGLTSSPSFPSASPMDDITLIEPSSDPVTTAVIEGLSEPTYPAEGFDYFLEIQNYLESQQYPPGVSENYKKCLKKRAQNYLMIDGNLYHNRKQPKEVIMRKDQQEDMLSDIHVVKETGIHLGVKKMFNKLHMKYFWRGMYTDVVNFAKKCDKCSDQQDLLRRRQSVVKDSIETEDSEEVEDPAPLSPCSVASPKPLSRNGSVVNVWKKVEVQMHGPFKKTCSRSEFILTMTDPVSQWLCAAAIPASGHPTHLAEFVFHYFCNYGFARCFLVGVSKDLCDVVSEEYVSRVTRLGEMFSSATLESLERDQSSCVWVEPLLERLVSTQPTHWDKHLDHFLFQYRMGELKEYCSNETPFSAMFNHNPLGFTIPGEDKENINSNSLGYQLRRRKPNTTFMKCRHCDSLFTSKISFRIHQRKHLGEASHRKHLLRKKRLRKTKNDVNNVLRQPDEKTNDTWRESTVSAVKALLQSTREERRRRGKYHKYTVELQEQMAAYAVKHGNPQAVRHFSERLGTVVSESTIRNLVKIHNSFTPAVKDEIGRFATHFGVEAAAKTFSEWLKQDVSQSLVRKFKSIFLSKQTDLKNQQDGQLKINHEKESFSNQISDSSSKGKRYTPKIKEEIGEYACSHSVHDTAEHFSKKLQTLVRERTVKRFYKSYLEKVQNQSNEQIASNESQVLEPIDEMENVNAYNTYQPVQNTPVTLYQLSQASNATTMCYQPTQAQSYETMQTFSSIPVPPHPPPPSYPVALIRSGEKTVITNYPMASENQQTQTCLIPQHSVLVTDDRNNSLISHFMTGQPLQQTILTIIPNKDGPKVNGEEQELEQFTTEGYHQENIQTVTELLTNQEKEQELLKKMTSMKDSKELEDLHVVTKTAVKKQSQKKKEKPAFKRGTYTAYSPEIRAEIGKYAAEYGSVKASQHFAKILGHEVPESTARGLKEKYLKKKTNCPVTSLGYSQRGRPLRLGKYDELVQECLKDIVRSGEKVSSFLAITTAKEILNKCEPGLLEENGGTLKLNTTWAKSFLKRIGVHNNS